MVRIKEFDDIILTISKKLVEAFPRKAHCNDSISDVAKIKVELAVSVAVSILWDESLDEWVFL